MRTDTQISVNETNLQALRELPTDVIIPARLVLSNEGMQALTIAA